MRVLWQSSLYLLNSHRKKNVYSPFSSSYCRSFSRSLSSSVSEDDSLPTEEFSSSSSSFSDVVSGKLLTPQIYLFDKWQTYRL